VSVEGQGKTVTQRSQRRRGHRDADGAEKKDKDSRFEIFKFQTKISSFKFQILGKTGKASMTAKAGTTNRQARRER
jgi:hypothetical protein